jgi:hypothetical protein
MAFRDGDELVEGLGLFGLGRGQVTLTQRGEEFGPRLLADPGVHRAPPELVTSH